LCLPCEPQMDAHGELADREPVREHGGIGPDAASGVAARATAPRTVVTTVGVTVIGARER
jgi:hypothetical protein